jgi:hypothetical protein
MLFSFAGDAFYIASISRIGLTCVFILPLTALTEDGGVVKGQRPSFGIGDKVHAGSTDVLGVPGGIIYLLLTYRTMLLLFHKIHFIFLYQKSEK